MVNAISVCLHSGSKRCGNIKPIKGETQRLKSSPFWGFSSHVRDVLHGFPLYCVQLKKHTHINRSAMAVADKRGWWQMEHESTNN